MMAYFYSILFLSFKGNAVYIRKAINRFHIIMKAIFLISFFCLINAEVVMIGPTSTCNSADCNIRLIDYVKKFNSRIAPKEDNGAFVSIISHIQPDSNMGGLYARAFITTSGEIEITDFTRTDDANYIYLHVRLTLSDVLDSIKCKRLPDDNRYFRRECSILIRYYDTAQDLVIKMYRFSLTVRIPRSEAVIIGTYAVFTNHGFIFHPALRFKTKTYIGEDCKNEISHGSPLRYSEYICFGIFGDDDISKSSEYKVASLSATYSRSGENDETVNMLNIAIIKASENTSVKGQMYIIIPMTYIGRLRLSTIIVLINPEEMLMDQNRDMRFEAGTINFPGVFEIDYPYGRFISDDYDNDDDDDSFGSLVEVGLSTLIVLLVILL